jgi:hypothetical protein
VVLSFYDNANPTVNFHHLDIAHAGQTKYSSIKIFIELKFDKVNWNIKCISLN